MRKFIVAASALALGLMAAAPPAQAANKIFNLVSAQTGCAVGAKGRVTVARHAPQDNMHVELSGLAGNTNFEVFLLQVPISPYGMSWYLGEIKTDANGLGVGDYAGNFGRTSFVVAPDTAPAPATYPTSATSNPATAPLQLYHVGVWYESPAASNAAGCGNAVTPFDGPHNAGGQVFNSANFPYMIGPLSNMP